MLKPKSGIKIRRRWKVKPQTKIKESAKGYSRSREKRQARKVIKNAAQKGTKVRLT